MVVVLGVAVELQEQALRPPPEVPAIQAARRPDAHLQLRPGQSRAKQHQPGQRLAGRLGATVGEVEHPPGPAAPRRAGAALEQGEEFRALGAPAEGVVGGHHRLAEGQGGRAVQHGAGHGRGQQPAHSDDVLRRQLGPVVDAGPVVPGTAAGRRDDVRCRRSVQQVQAVEQGRRGVPEHRGTGGAQGQGGVHLPQPSLRSQVPPPGRCRVHPLPDPEEVAPADGPGDGGRREAEVLQRFKGQEPAGQRGHGVRLTAAGPARPRSGPARGRCPGGGCVSARRAVRTELDAPDPGMTR